MPSDVIIKIKCPDYLIKFLEKIYGEMPICFPKTDDLLRALHHLLNRPPKTYIEDSEYDGMLLIQLPYFNDKNVISNFYLSEYSKKLFLSRLTRYFKLVFIDDVNKSRLNGFDCKTSINLFIDKYELNNSIEIFDTLEKYYNRYFQVRYQVKHLRKKRKKMLSH